MNNKWHILVLDLEFDNSRVDRRLIYEFGLPNGGA